MLTDSGTISFVDELIGVVDRFLAEYEAKQGPPRNKLERALVVSYALGVLHCQLDAVWNALGDSPMFGGLHPRLLFQECVAKDEESLEALQQEIATKLEQKAWYTGQNAKS
jgi:hypothetical protein